MKAYMVSQTPFTVIFFCASLLTIATTNFYTQSPLIYPFNCSQTITACDASLYHVNNGLTPKQIASYYSLINKSQIKTISYENRLDYLITVPCSCKNVNGTVGYFYDTSYRVQQGDTFAKISSKMYNGQAWAVGGEALIRSGTNIAIHLPCGCVKGDSQLIATYTVHVGDTLTDISNLLSATKTDIEKLNKGLIQNPNSIKAGWVLYVPRDRAH